MCTLKMELFKFINSISEKEIKKNKKLRTKIGNMKAELKRREGFLQIKKKQSLSKYLNKDLLNN